MHGAGRQDRRCIHLPSRQHRRRPLSGCLAVRDGVCWDDSAVFCKVPTLAVPSFAKPGVGADQVSGTEYIDCRVSWVVWWEEWLDGISFASI